MTYRTKAYHAALLDHALGRLRNGDAPREVIVSLISIYGCARSTAHRVTKKALGTLAGTQDANGWGGQRPNAGRPIKALKNN